MTSDDRSNSVGDDFVSLLAETLENAHADIDEPRVRIPLRLPASWSQGRATFGGLQAGLAVAGLAHRFAADGDDRTLRSMQVEFIAPASGMVELELELLRSGRSATMARATIYDGDAIAMTLGVCFGGHRESEITLAGSPPPTLRGPEGLVRLPFIRGVTPGFVRYVEMCWAEGGPPSSGLGEPDACAGWVRTHEPFGPVVAYLPMLIDAWPAPALQHFDRMVPASSVSWSVDFVGLDTLDPGAGSDDWWIYAAETDGAGGGWVHTRAKLWTADGHLVATSRQTVALYG